MVVETSKCYKIWINYVRMSICTSIWVHYSIFFWKRVHVLVRKEFFVVVFSALFYDSRTVLHDFSNQIALPKNHFRTVLPGKTSYANRCSPDSPFPESSFIKIVPTRIALPCVYTSKVHQILNKLFFYFLIFFNLVL